MIAIMKLKIYKFILFITSDNAEKTVMLKNNVYKRNGKIIFLRFINVATEL
jgi:hypothetical protein